MGRAYTGTGRDAKLSSSGNPHCLDIDWRWCRYAKEQGIKISINPDAHNTFELGYSLVGLGIARKGWLEKEDILNAMTREE
ncbi:MAG: histidinol-phosphatase, partial [Clostridia bacterium]|nr:histidinol-phosphatase [Clostridia bacterium]